MSRTTKRSDKPWYKRWGKKRGKEYKQRLNRSIRKQTKIELLGAKPKSVAGKRSDVNYRGT